ncbi:MAG: ion transporter [Leptospirales bacterium]|nr:ion transporter [Leptospirales bacterium]
MIKAHTLWKRIWDAYVVLVTIYAAVEIPLRLTVGYELTAMLLWMDRLMIATFSVDIILNFQTRIYVNGQEVADRRAIARNYLSGWFIIDLIAALPFDLIIAGWLPHLTYAARTLRLVRLFRLVRIAQVMQRITEANIISVGVLRMLFLGFWVLLVAHWTATIWMAIGGGNIPAEDQADNGRYYIRALYWSITTMVTIGYGDITPQSTGQTIFAMAIEIAGAAMYGYVIGNVASVIANLDVARSQYLEKLERVSTFMSFRRIPEDLQERVRRYYAYLWQSRRGYDESHVLQDLPGSLHTQLSLYLNSSLIQKVPLFKGASPDLIQQIVLSLRPAVFTPGDYVFRKGELGADMFFISRGAVEVVSEDGRTVYATLHEGDFFGEIALLESSPRTASVRAVDYCDLYTIDKESFERVLRNYPDFAEGVQALARERRQMTGDRRIQERQGRRPEGVINLHGFRKSSGIVELTWSRSAGAAVYQAARQQPGEESWRMLNGCIERLDYYDESAPGEPGLRYRVRAVNQNGPGDWSEAVDV